MSVKLSKTNGTTPTDIKVSWVNINGANNGWRRVKMPYVCTGNNTWKPCYYYNYQYSNWSSNFYEDVNCTKAITCGNGYKFRTAAMYRYNMENGAVNWNTGVKVTDLGFTETELVSFVNNAPIGGVANSTGEATYHLKARYNGKACIVYTVLVYDYAIDYTLPYGVEKVRITALGGGAGGIVADIGRIVAIPPLNSGWRDYKDVDCGNGGGDSVVYLNGNEVVRGQGATPARLTISVVYYSYQVQEEQVYVTYKKVDWANQSLTNSHGTINGQTWFESGDGGYHGRVNGPDVYDIRGTHRIWGGSYAYGGHEDGGWDDGYGVRCRGGTGRVKTVEIAAKGGDVLQIRPGGAGAYNNQGYRGHGDTGSHHGHSLSSGGPGAVMIEYGY